MTLILSVGLAQDCLQWADRTPPVNPSELTFLAVDTRSPYTREYPSSEGGKQAHYMLRWFDTRGETGPWSETATATIGA